MKKILLHFVAVLLIANCTAYSQPTAHKPDFPKFHTTLEGIEHEIASPRESFTRKNTPGHPNKRQPKKIVVVNGQTVVELSQYWNNGEWVDYQRDTLTYDANGHLNSDLEQNWYGYSNWMNLSLSDYAYDTNGHETTYLIQFWNEGGWLYYSRDTLTYDSNGHLLTDLNQNWNDSTWNDVELYSYTYDTNGYESTRLDQLWNGTTWDHGYKDTFTYDVNGNRTNLLEQHWIDSSWVNIWITNYIYNARGLEASNLYQIWTDSGLVNTELYSYTYDSIGHLLTGLYQQWNDSSWGNWFEDNYAYDGNGNIIYAVELWWYDTIWVNSGRALYTYLLTSVEENPKLPTRISLSNNWPNPFNNSTQIKYTLKKASDVTLKVYDVLGREITILVSGKNEPGEHSISWNAENVPSGVYFYRLVAGGFDLTKKMVLMK